MFGFNCWVPYFRGSNDLFLNWKNMPVHQKGELFLKKLISTPWTNFSGKTLCLFQLQIFEQLKSKIHFSVFAVYRNGVWPHTFSKLKNKHIISFLDPFPVSVKHFTSLKGGVFYHLNYQSRDFLLKFTKLVTQTYCRYLCLGRLQC